MSFSTEKNARKIYQRGERLKGWSEMIGIVIVVMGPRIRNRKCDRDVCRDRERFLGIWGTSKHLTPHRAVATLTVRQARGLLMQGIPIKSQAYLQPSLANELTTPDPQRDPRACRQRG